MSETILVLQPGLFQLCVGVFSISYASVCILFIVVIQAQSGEPDVRAEVKTAEHAHTKPRPEKVRTLNDACCRGC